jgi:hypothetical protein
MKKLFLVSLLFAVSFAGCHEGDSPSHVLTLSVADKASYVSGSENWLIVHDERGALVTYKKITQGSDIAIDAETPLPGSTIGVTFLRYYPLNDGEQWDVTTYLQIPIGEKLTLSNYPELSFPDVGEITGTFTVNATGLDNIDQFALTDNIRETCDGVNSNAGVTFNCTTRDKANKHILTLGDDNEVRYHVFENVKQGDVYNISYADMVAFDKTYSFSFEPSSLVLLEIVGRDPGQTVGGYGIGSHISGAGDTHSHITAGYLNSLTNYATYLTVVYPGYNYTYQNIGSIPDGPIQWPSPPDYRVSTSAISNFTCSATKPFDYRTSSWRDQNDPSRVIFWRIHSPSGNQSLSELPAEILAKYPSLSFNHLRYVSTEFVTSTTSYADMIRNDLATFESGPDKTVSITIKAE